MNRFFAFDPNEGFNTYATEHEARQAAEASLEAATDGEYAEWVEQICWGEIKRQVVAVNTRTVEQVEADGDELFADQLRSMGVDYTCEFEFVPPDEAD